MATSSADTIVMVDPEYLNQDDDIIGGDASDLIPIDMGDDFEDDPEFTPGFATPEEVENGGTPVEPARSPENDIISQE